MFVYFSKHKIYAIVNLIKEYKYNIVILNHKKKDFNDF